MNRIPNWLLYSLVGAVTAVWITSFVASLVNTTYSPPESVNLLFSSIVGGLILQASGKKKDDDDDDSKKDKVEGGS